MTKINIAITIYIMVAWKTPRCMIKLFRGEGVVDGGVAVKGT